MSVPADFTTLDISGQFTMVCRCLCDPKTPEGLTLPFRTNP